MLRVGRDNLDLPRGMSAHQLLEQTRAVRMKFYGRDRGSGVAVGEGERLTARSGTAVENAASLFENARADERRDELRGFVLDDDLAVAEGLGFRDVYRRNPTGRGEE